MIADAMRENLARVRSIRTAARSAGDDRLRLRTWQADRLARTYADLLENPRYRPAAHFFLDDLYGPKDFSERDDEVARILPTMTRLLPVSAVQTLGLAVELDCLSEELDAALLNALRSGTGANAPLVIDGPRYAVAFRQCANRADRERQVALVGQIGAALDALARKSLIAKAVEMMRVPAHAAGLGELHEFLERGFLAFRGMRGATEFLGIIDRRERRILDRLFAGDPDPFRAED
ncbi:MAG: hypothetical protein LJE97_01430 [Betaproteobacteria bacterium]|nr:hypothetical protein [Betaproteobacteria bacterium]